jgi:hypothetical protein
MRDVGFALEAAGGYERRLNRIGLQKFIYLCDVVSTLYEILPPLQGHHTYKHGPYDPAVQNAVDSLAFRGLVRVYGVDRDQEGRISATYTLTEPGSLLARNLAAAQPFRARWRVAVDVARRVEGRGWQRLRELAYAEPTYANERVHGLGRPLRPEQRLGNTAGALLATLRRTLTLGFREASPSGDLILELFFRYLDNYAKIVHRTPVPDLSSVGGLDV